MNLFDRVLEKYGRDVTVRDAAETEKTGKAFVRPVLGRDRRDGEDAMTTLGEVSRARYLYLGQAALDLTGLRGRGYVILDGRALDIRRAEAIYVGGILTHWWAVLEPRPEEV